MRVPPYNPQDDDVLVSVYGVHRRIPFTAGIVLRPMAGTEMCVHAAPILGWCRGKSRSELRAEFDNRRWRAVVVPRTKSVVAAPA